MTYYFNYAAIICSFYAASGAFIMRPCEVRRQPNAVSSLIPYTIINPLTKKATRQFDEWLFV